MRCPACGTLASDACAQACASCGYPLGPPGGVLRIVAFLEEAALAFLVCGMVVLVLVQIVLRDVFSTGITGGSEAVRHMVLWVAFIGAGLAAREGRHIRIDALQRVLPVKTRTVLDIVTSVFTMAVCAVLMAASVGFIRVDHETSTSILFHSVRVPVWILETVIPLGYAMVLARYLIRSALQVRSLLGGSKG